MTNRFVLATARTALLLLDQWPVAKGQWPVVTSYKLQVTNCGAFERRSYVRELHFELATCNL